MNRGLLSGLTKAEKRPYEGWKTNSFVERSGSPENDDVCLLEDDCTTVDVEDSPKSMKCLSDGNKNPWDYNSKDSSYKIPKRTDSSDEQETKGVTWFKSSFPEKDNLPQRNFRTRSAIERQRNHTNRITQKKEIGYRMLRQAGPSCATRQWKHTSAPGWLSRCQREKTVCKAPETKCNGAVPMNNTEQNAQRTSSALKEGYDRSLLDSILQGNTVSKDNLSNGENSRSNSTSSDTNFRMKMSITPLLDSPTSSKDVLSDDNYDDAFADHCDKCTSRLSRDKSCPSCEKDIFPSQAATPRRPLSPDRFYSADGQKPKVQRTYNKTRGNGARVLLMGNAAKSTDTKTSVGSCPTTSRLKRRKNQGKSNSDSDSDYTPGKKRNGKQLKLTLPKKVDVITLSDEEEVEETTAALVVEEGSQCDTSAAGSNSFNLLPESPNSAEEGCGKGEVKFDSINAEECSETSAKRKTPPSKEKQPAKKKSNNLHGYTRDDLEIEIMVRQDICIGTLACTATDPLKITCKTDEIKLSVDYGKKNLLLTITGNDLTSFKISHGLNPDVIVLGVTPGYALKLAQKIPNQGKFLNPGSAVAAERDIVLEVSEHVKTEVIADLMEWVTDKLSKEFGELSLKEVERIKAFKTPTSTSKEQNQSANEATSTLMTTRSRTYNTRSNSCIRPVQNAQRLVVFPPPPQPGGITVTSEDIPCLDAGEFLNDVIIDFYLKFVFFEKLKPEDRARTHILSSFFYKRLTQRSTNNSDTFSSPPDRMHSQVKTWTKNVDIFEKDFVFVPINESSHWYLAVICFAGHTRATYINEIADEDDETNSKNKDPDVDTTIEKKSENDDDDEKDGSDNDDDDFELTSLATLQSTSTKRNTRKRKSLPKQTIRSQPCILVFDSLGGQRQRCMTNLRNYLKVEWRERKKDAETRDFNKDNIKGSHPKVPQQDNFCDCGVYVLQYMESFFEDPITDFSLPIRKDDWFSREIITEKRNDIRHVIFGLKVAAETENS